MLGAVGLVRYRAPEGVAMSAETIASHLREKNARVTCTHPTVAEASAEATGIGRLGGLPKLPSRAGDNGRQWYTELNGGELQALISSLDYSILHVVAQQETPAHTKAAEREQLEALRRKLRHLLKGR